MTHVVNEPYLQCQAAAVGVYERLITGLRQELGRLGTQKKVRGRPIKEKDDSLQRRITTIKKDIELCQCYRMQSMRNIDIPVPTIAAMVGCSVDEVESSIRIAQYESIPSIFEPTIAAGKYVEPVKE